MYDMDSYCADVISVVMISTRFTIPKMPIPKTGTIMHRLAICFLGIFSDNFTIRTPAAIHITGMTGIQ
ncbi:hypothetical protein DYY66_1577 [Candidatus Nitrosotalea sp. FS]|nr:hypothetical protein [Candidatus Nitrosotalea sp. FS]